MPHRHSHTKEQSKRDYFVCLGEGGRGGVRLRSPGQAPNQASTSQRLKVLVVLRVSNTNKQTNTTVNGVRGKEGKGEGNSSIATVPLSIE